MRYRMLGKTQISLSEIGFGCGNVGGLLIRGEDDEQVKAIRRALELGINYFDTAAAYGDGLSEINLGRALAQLKPDVILGTKLRLGPDDATPERIRQHFATSLSRLQRDSVDILYYHGRIRMASADTG